MGVPQVYRKADERAIVSFDFIEIASGEGFTNFFGFSDSEDLTVNDGATISLISQELTSGVVTTGGNNAVTGTDISVQN